MKSPAGTGSSEGSHSSVPSSSSFSSHSPPSSSTSTSSSSSSSSSSSVVAAATAGRRAKSERTPERKEEQYTSIFNIDGEKKIVVATATELLCVPYSMSIKNLSKRSLSKNPKYTELPLSDICILSKKTSSTLTAHCLLTQTQDPQGPRQYRCLELTLVGPFGSFTAPFTNDYDEPVEGWYKLLLGRVHKANGDPAARRPVLAIVNPYAGVKRAESVWTGECAPMLRAAGLRFHTFVTKSPGDAYEAVKSADLSAYSTVATIGGDGIFNEAINGLMARDDWETAVGEVSFASIPAGTGNAAAHTMYGSMDPHCATCHIVKGATHKADLYLAAQPSIGQYIWGILGCSYGIIAEADFGSEKIRWAGSMRPSIWAFYRILCGSVYNCRLTYLPTETPRQEWHGARCTRDCKTCRHALKVMSSDHVDSELDKAEEDNDSTTGERSHSAEEKCDHRAKKEDDEEEGKEETPKRAISVIKYTSGEAKDGESAGQEAEFVLSEDIKYHTSEPELSTIPSYGPAYTSSLTACRDWTGDVPTKFAQLFGSYLHNPVSSYTHTENALGTTESGPSGAKTGLPKGWAALENQSLSFCSFQKLPWLMPGMLAAPYAHFLDGCMDISYALSESFSRITFMKLFSLFPDGSYLNNPKLSYLKVRAFTLEPLDNDGYIGIDGERIRYAPLHFHIVRALVNLVSYN